MNCQQAHNCIHALLDEELPVDRMPALQAHLQDCASCRDMLEQLRAMAGGFRWLAAGSETVPGPSPQPLAEPPAVVPFPRRWAVVGAAVAAAAALLVFTIGPWSRPLETVHTVSVPESRDDPYAAAPPDHSFTLRLVGDAHDNYLAVPQTSSRPGVHIVWLYKTRSSPEPQGSQRSKLTADHLLTRS